MNKDEAYKLHHEWIDRCLASDNLTEWEDCFINSIKQQLEKRGFLTPKQVEALEQIYADKTD